MSTPCFWVERTGDAEVIVRRYASGTECPEQGYHDAKASIGRYSLVLTDDGMIDSLDGTLDHGDPSWPVSCGCGYRFTDEDRWQVNQEPYYRSSDGREWQARNLPPGAMLDAYWQPEAWKGPDGMAVTVILPEGPYVEGMTDTRSWWWIVDGPATEASKLIPHAWSRTGDPKANPPTISATPSINAVGRYHGFLTNGVLTDNLG